MGLDCYIRELNNDGSIGSEVTYFRKFWCLHNWMIDYFTSNGGELDREDGGNGQNVTVDRHVIEELFKDMFHRRNYFEDVPTECIQAIAGSFGNIIKALDENKTLVYYGSF